MIFMHGRRTNILFMKEEHGSDVMECLCMHGICIFLHLWYQIVGKL